jgi:hypothetical protein
LICKRNTDSFILQFGAAEMKQIMAAARGGSAQGGLCDPASLSASGDKSALILFRGDWTDFFTFARPATTCILILTVACTVYLSRWRPPKPAILE